MQKFTNLKSIPAYLPIVNIDTDMIIPKQFLKTIKRTGLGKNLFYEMRYDVEGKIINDFILNQSPFNESKILIHYFRKLFSHHLNQPKFLLFYLHTLIILLFSRHRE